MKSENPPQKNEKTAQRVPGEESRALDIPAWYVPTLTP